MNKNDIKKFAIDARNKLIASVTDKAGMLGITPDGCGTAITKGADFEVYKTVAGTEVTLNRKQCEQRRKLVDQINSRGFEAVIEEVAYTWFNRICAIRFMEVNDYMYPVRVRILSSEKEGKNEPDILTMAPDVDWNLTDKEREYIIEAKINNKLDDLFKMLFIKQCNLLHEVLPGLFEETEDYTEMLLNISFTNEDDVVRMLVDGIDEKDFNVNTLDENGEPTGQVEIIGWLYQYYNTELKDDTFAKLKKNVKISKERIPAATQLFTPDWIVRYMVENSVGRVWIEHLKAVDNNADEKALASKFGWKYYLPEAEQEESIKKYIVKIKSSYADLTPEDILCIDPCMGSGHILIAMFDVLMDVYESAGYDKREATFEIVKNNIHGLDIDKRAFQLAYFAIMMKGRGFNRRFLSGRDGHRPEPKVYAFIESNNINTNHINYMGHGYDGVKKNKLREIIDELCRTFRNARECGSILKIDKYDWNELRKYIYSVKTDSQLTFDTVGIDNTQFELDMLLKIAELLSNSYNAVITNPPYMSISNGGKALNDYVKAYYNNSKSDLYAVFIEQTSNLLAQNGFQALITQQSWMFLSSFEKLRRAIRMNDTINMLQLGARAFEEIGGEVVQTTTFVKRKYYVKGYKSTYCKLTNANSQKAKERMYLSGENRFFVSSDRFENIPGEPIAFWVSEKVFRAYREYKPLGQVCDVKNGMSTTNNNRFVRHWSECDLRKIGIGYGNAQLAQKSMKKWFPYNKGGEYRKWYGNIGLVVNWEDNGKEIKKAAEGASGGRIVSQEYYFKRSVSWSKVSSGKFALRMFPEGFLFDVAGPGIFGDYDVQKYILAALNSSLNIVCLQELYPTMNYEMGQVSSFPICIDDSIKKEILDLVEENIEIEKLDWDSYETSWDFKRHPLVPENKGSYLIEDLFANWIVLTCDRKNRLKSNEERINELFLKLYDLENELFSTVLEENLSIRTANRESDIKSLLSYIVGCVMGRYSIEKDGVCYEGVNEYSHNEFWDEDGIIPITDEEYFSDDIVSLIVKFVADVYGKENVVANMKYIADSISRNGNSPQEIIRTYFINDFYKEHCATYSAGILGKKPIYWLFDSGKENGFKALVYIHRYSEDMVGEIRTEYLHKAQKAIEQALLSAEYTRDNATSGAEKSLATKKITKYTKQLAEIKLYDEAISHIAMKRIALDLDDGVKINYEKFQNIEVSQEGKKNLKLNLLAKI